MEFREVTKPELVIGKEYYDVDVKSPIQTLFRFVGLRNGDVIMEYISGRKYGMPDADDGYYNFGNGAQEWYEKP